jgi:tetraacyldisaccharide 4'-kinase
VAIDQTLQGIWYRRTSALMLLLLPLSWLFGLIVAFRRVAFEKRWFATTRIRVPVIVVGNITVGGTGKTPFSMWLAQQLIDDGFRVGIVLRGYGGKAKQWPQHVESTSDWRIVGDEAVLIASQVKRAIVVADPDRVRAAEKAIELGADIIVSDDGLQHYRLQRDVEILVVDEQRRFGNGRLLPAGPLREPVVRSKSVDLCVMSRRLGSDHPLATASKPSEGQGAIVAMGSLKYARNMRDESIVPLDQFRGSYVHALAAIGHPAAFFDALRARGLEVREHVFRDHAELSESDITFADDAPVLMTQKDAIKCRAFASDRHWSVPLDLELGASDTQLIKGMIERIIRFRGRSVSADY